MSTTYFSESDARSLVDLLSPNIPPEASPQPSRQPLFVLAWAQGSIAAGSATVPGYGTARLQENSNVVPVANLGNAVSDGAFLLLRREQISNTFVIDGGVPSCCLTAAELPTKVSIDGVQIIGTWTKLSDCCWCLVSDYQVVIPGFNSFERCDLVHERVSKHVCWDKHFFYDWLSIPVYAGSGPVPTVSASPLRTIKTEQIVRQEGAIRIQNHSSKINVYLTRTKQLCDGVEECRWGIGVTATDVNGSIHIVKQVYSINTTVSEEFRSPVLDITDGTGTAPCPSETTPTGTTSTTSSTPTCEISSGVGSLIAPYRGKVSSSRPDSVTLANGDTTPCGGNGCIPIGSDSFILTLNCSDIPDGRICGATSSSEPPAPSTVVARQLHPTNGKHQYLRNPFAAFYIRSSYNSAPIGQPLPNYPATNCSIDGVSRYITEGNKTQVAADYAWLNLSSNRWKDPVVILSETCSGSAAVTIELPTIEVEFEWPS